MGFVDHLGQGLLAFYLFTYTEMEETNRQVLHSIQIQMN